MLPTPDTPTRSMEETLLMLDHLLGKMSAAITQQNDVLRVQLSRLEAQVALGVPATLALAPDEAARKADALGFSIQECSEWLRTHQHAAEQHIRAIQDLTDQVRQLTAGSGAAPLP